MAATVALLGACGDDDESRPSVSVTLPPATGGAPTSEGGAETTLEPTTTRPPLTTRPPATTEAPPTTDAPTTTQAPATTQAPPTTRGPIIIVPPTTEAPTTTQPPPTTEAALTTAASTTTLVPASTSDDDSDTWIWLLLALLAIAAVVGGIVMRNRRRHGTTAAWAAATNRAVDQGRLIVDGLGSAAASHGAEEPALQQRLHAFDATLADLEAKPPSTEQGRAVTTARGAVAEVDTALQADLRLRIGPPAPTEDQLATSSAVIASRGRDLGAALDRLAQTATQVSTATT